MVLLDLSAGTAVSWPIAGHANARWILGPNDFIVSQNQNNWPSVYCSEAFPFGSSVEGTMTMPGRDDDAVGFTYGFSPGGDSGTEFLIFTWNNEWSVSLAEDDPRLESDPLLLNSFGPWRLNTNYLIRFEFGCESIKLYVDGVLEIDLPRSVHPDEDSEFCFYTRSQQARFIYFDMEPLGTVCETPTPANITTLTPTDRPSDLPTSTPTAGLTTMPTLMPEVVPTSLPSAVPSTGPTDMPSSVPSTGPTLTPSVNPTAMPSSMPSTCPTTVLTLNPASTETNFYLWNPLDDSALAKITQGGEYDLGDFDVGTPPNINVVYDASCILGVESVSFVANGQCFCQSTIPFALFDEEAYDGDVMPPWDFEVGGNTILVGLHNSELCNGQLLGSDYVNFDLTV